MIILHEITWESKVQIRKTSIENEDKHQKREINHVEIQKNILPLVQNEQFIKSSTILEELRKQNKTDSLDLNGLTLSCQI